MYVHIYMYMYNRTLKYMVSKVYAYGAIDVVYSRINIHAKENKGSLTHLYQLGRDVD